MTQSDGEELMQIPDTKPAPEHCDRRMLAVIDRNSSSPFYNLPIWWCPECHTKIPRRKDEVERPEESPR